MDIADFDELLHAHDHREMAVRLAFLQHAGGGPGAVLAPEQLAAVLQDLQLAPPDDKAAAALMDPDGWTFMRFMHVYNKCTPISATATAAAAAAAAVPPGMRGMGDHSQPADEARDGPDLTAREAGVYGYSDEGNATEGQLEAVVAATMDPVGDHNDAYHMHGVPDAAIDFKSAAGTRLDPTEEQKPYHSVRNPHLRPQGVMVQGSAASNAKSAEREYQDKLIAWVQSMEAVDTSDYSLGFSGTKQDTNVEKAAAEIMRGGPAEQKREFAEQPCTCQMTEEGKHAKDCSGQWLRTLNKQKTAYLYVHTITHQVTGVKPDGFYDPEEERRKAVLAAAGEFPDFPSCYMENLEQKIRETLATHKKAPLLLAATEDMYEELKEWFGTSIAEDKKGEPIPRGYVMDTRPMVLGQTRTGVKFEDCVKECKKAFVSSIRNESFAVVDIHNKAPNFADKVCAVKDYKNLFPMNVFDPKARGWRKDMLQFTPKTDGDAVLLLSVCSPGDYEAELKENLDPLPWTVMYPIHVQNTPIEISDMTDLLDNTVACLQGGRTPIMIDNTANKGTVDMFWNYQRTYVIDVDAAEFTMKGQTPAQDPQNHAAILHEWRRKLVGAMRQGYFLVIKMGDSRLDFRDFCQDNMFPYCVFKVGAVQAPEVREALYMPEDLENNIAVLRDGFGVVVTTTHTVETFKQKLKASLPLRHMKGMVAM